MRVRKHGGGKLSRSETVTVRLDPKVRYLAELAARAQRRTLSSFIEWAVETALSTQSLVDGGVTVAKVGEQLWDVNELERFVKLASSFPHLLTSDELERWKQIRSGQIPLDIFMRLGEGRDSLSVPEVLAILDDLRVKWELNTQRGGLNFAGLILNPDNPSG